MAELNEKELENAVDGIYGILDYVKTHTEELFSEEKERYYFLDSILSISNYNPWRATRVGDEDKDKEFKFSDLNVSSLEELLHLVRGGIRFSKWGNNHKKVELYVKPPVDWNDWKVEIATFGYTCPQAPNKIFIGPPRFGPEVRGGFNIQTVHHKKNCKYCDAELFYGKE